MYLFYKVCGLSGTSETICFNLCIDQRACQIESLHDSVRLYIHIVSQNENTLLPNPRASSLYHIALTVCFYSPHTVQSLLNSTVHWEQELFNYSLKISYPCPFPNPHTTPLNIYYSSQCKAFAQAMLAHLAFKNFFFEVLLFRCEYVQ